MGNQSSSSSNCIKDNISNKKILQNYLTVPIYSIQNANLVKYVIDFDNDKNINCDNNEKYYIQKLLSCQSEQEYNFLTSFLQKQSLFQLHQHTFQLTKILKISQQSEKTLCSNRYLIKILFEYSDITMRHEIQTRSGQFSRDVYSKDNEKHYFRYEDLCNIMFACISSLLIVERMKENVKKIFNQNQNQKIINSINTKLDFIMSQLRFSIPINVDRLVILSDGSIKILHPLILDHESRIRHSPKFFYSPEKIKDFFQEDGLKGRFFQIGLVVLQCGLLETSEEMNKIYNGYCINQKLLSAKLNKAVDFYCKMQNLQQTDMNLFLMIKKMIKISPEERIGLDQCVQQTQRLFQTNKLLKQTMLFSNWFSASKPESKRDDKMRIQELQSSQYLCKINIEKSKANPEQKTTARMSSKRNHHHNQYQFQVSDFNAFNQYLYKYPISTRQNTERMMQFHKNLKQSKSDPKQSIQVTQNQKHFQNGLQSLVGKQSNLYNTMRFNNINDQTNGGYEYKDFVFLPKNCDKQNYDQSNSLNVQSKSFKYETLLNRSKQSSQKKRSNSKQIISKSNFFDIDKVYEKYGFIKKTQQSQEQQQFFSINSNYHTNNSNNFNNIYNKKLSPLNSTKKSLYMTGKNGIAFTSSIQNSSNSKNRKSIVIEKISNMQLNVHDIEKRIRPIRQFRN